MVHYVSLLLYSKQRFKVVATENVRSLRLAAVGFCLNLSKGLSPHGRGHYHKHVTLTCAQNLNSPHCVPIHKFRARDTELYESTHNVGVREAKFDRLGPLNALDLFGRKRDFQRFDILLQVFHLPPTD